VHECRAVASIRVGWAGMADILLLNRTAEPATRELQSSTPMHVVLRIANNLRPLFRVGKQNVITQELSGSSEFPPPFAHCPLNADHPCNHA
jgi:hypothetical protein